MKSRTALPRLAVGFFLSSAGFKNKSLRPHFHPHLHMPPLLQRPVLTVITSYLLYVIAGSSRHLQPLMLAIGRGNEVKV